MPEDLQPVARLAAGVAKSINDILTVVGGHAEIASRTLPPDAPEQEDLAAIREATARGAWLTRQLLAFGQGGQPVLTPCSLNGIVQECGATLMANRPPDITIELDLAAAVPLVLADHDRVVDLILILFTNACDAMPGGGSLTIRTDRPDADAPGFAVLEVVDTGEGIPPELQARIFDPFFTTRGSAGRTGLGLAGARGLLEQTGGSLTVTSAPGDGATLRALLPVYSA